jgi:hypothetical protein
MVRAKSSKSNVTPLLWKIDTHQQIITTIMAVVVMAVVVTIEMIEIEIKEA